LNKKENQRSKRVFDVVSSLAILITSPILVFMVEKPKNMFKNIFKVVKGRTSWVGYSKSFNQSNELPLLKKGVLSPIDRFGKESPNQPTLEKVNIQYVKDYHIFNDLAILIKGLKRIGN
jgi:lipopolysaccharide/colanic/teichoic acid biosynthesis glycosyltransferase